jgi:hypothetical protein
LLLFVALSLCPLLTAGYSAAKAQNHNPMSDNEQKAHDLFFQTELNQQQIADLLNVNRKTLYGWIKQGNWIRAKCAAAYAPVVLAEQYYAQLAAMNNKIAERDDPFPTKEEADIIRKITATVNAIRNEKATCSETIQVLTNFTDDMLLIDPELTKKVIVHMNVFIKGMTDQGMFMQWGKDLRKEKEFERDYLEWVNTHRPPAPPDAPSPEVPITPNSPTAPVMPQANKTIPGAPGGPAGHHQSGAPSSPIIAPTLPSPFPPNTDRDRVSVGCAKIEKIRAMTSPQPLPEKSKKKVIHKTIFKIGCRASNKRLRRAAPVYQ